MDNSEKELMEPQAKRLSIDDKKVDLARHLFITLEQQVALADRKAQALFGLNAFLVAALSLQNDAHLKTLMTQGLSLELGLQLLLKTAFFCCICIGTWSTIKVLRPQMHRIDTDDAAPKRTLYFFDDIRAQNVHEFTDAFLSLNNEQSARELLTSAYSISVILGYKYKMLKRSTFCILIALSIWVITLVTRFLL